MTSLYDPKDGEDSFRLAVNKIKEHFTKDNLNVNPLLPQPAFLLVVVAPRKSGKTNLTVDLLHDAEKYNGKFDVVVVWSRTYEHDSKWKNINLPEGSVLDSFVESEALEILNAAEHVSKTKQVNTLFIFDDMITEGIMSPHKMGVLENIAVRGRHANVSIIIITQQYMALSPSVRNNATNSVFFRIRNGDELEKVARENREGMRKEAFLEMFADVTADPYSFLHINNQQADPTKRFWKNWDTMVDISTYK